MSAQVSQLWAPVTSDQILSPDKLRECYILRDIYKLRDIISEINSERMNEPSFQIISDFFLEKAKMFIFGIVQG